MRLAGVTAAWYEREITVPAEWAGRRIAVYAEYVNSHATVFVDGRRAGEIRFPGGELDLTPLCRPGGKHVLSLLVTALPLKAVMLSYSDTASARQVRGTVPRRGLCGDVYLVATPPGARINDVRVDTSVRKGQISCDTAVHGLTAGGRYTLRARIVPREGNAIPITSKPFTPSDLERGRITFSGTWKAEQLWDLHTPGNRYSLSLSLLDASGQELDRFFDVPFGFREFWIDGRDFYLNGTRIFLSAVPIDNAQLGAAQATYEACARDHGTAQELRHQLRLHSQLRLRARLSSQLRGDPAGGGRRGHAGRASRSRTSATTTGGQPTPTPTNGYERHAEFYVRRAGNHPSVVFYSMSHNATGYSEDMNPDMIDGVHDPRETWAQNNAKLALRAEAIVRRLDPSRIVYHHASGNLGSMHTTNFYPNFVPDPGALRLVRALGHPGCQAGVHLRVRRAVHLGLGHVPRAGTRGSGPSAMPGSRGSFASPSGTRSSSATGPTGSARWRRPTCVGRPSSFAPGTSGIGGIIPMSSARRSSTIATP